MNFINREECELLGDSKYRAYVSQVEKALRNFEYTSEWADLISALGKLNKVLMNHVKYPVVPKRVTIGKRLAQCLHPALPSGVHLKALETYDIIFKCVGTTRLAADLFTYSAGLFPLMAYAAMNVKPALLLLYETHFIPLRQNLRPALTGMLLGLLPGLEEGSEFDRCNRILEELSQSVGLTYFHGCLWECVLSMPGIRLPAINFVVSHYIKKQSMEDQLFIIGTSIDLLVEALCIAVQDSSVLVQRSSLDLLMTGFRLHNSQLTRPDLVKVVTAAIKVLLRRDMSLNRRLYAWLLGTDMSGASLLPSTIPSSDGKSVPRADSISTCSETEMGYFNTYAKDLLVQGIQNCINESMDFNSRVDDKSSSNKPFRILTSLLDKPEVGSVILEDVLMDIFRCMYKECIGIAADVPEGTSVRRDSGSSQSGKNNSKREMKDKKDEKTSNSEIIKTANLLFGTFEPYFIWDFISRNFETFCQSEEKRLIELCTLVDFLLDKVSLETYIETQTEYLPELLRQIILSLCAHCKQLNAIQLTSSLKLCSKILARVLPSMTPVGCSDQEGSKQGSPHKRPFMVRGDASENQSTDTGQLSESEVYISADSETGDFEEDFFEEIEEEQYGYNEKRHATDTCDTEFADYVQYQEKSEDIEIKSPNKSPSKSPLKQKTMGQPPTIMQACVQSFQRLFCEIITNKLLKNMSLCYSLLDQLILPFDDNAPISSSTTDHMTNFGAMRQPQETSKSKSQWDVRKILLDPPPPDLCKTFSCCCQLLVDFSCFPLYCVNYHKLLETTFRKGSDLQLPEWLQILLLCTCFTEQFSIQSSSISTMLDLLSLTQSVIQENVDKGQGENERIDILPEGILKRGTSDGTVSVVIVPSLTPQHFRFLEQQTCFFQLVASTLWNCLGEDKPACHQRSVELLMHLHQLAPSPWICEDVIGNALLSYDKSVAIAAHKRFAVLWHLLRDKRQPNNGNKVGRSLDRSLFLMLDSLQSDTHPCRSITQTWLMHAVQRGDVARILEPLLLILLHPDTARISIQHLSVHNPRRIRICSGDQAENDVTDSEANIYAISSEGGNVIYHVSNATKVLSRRSSKESKTYALTTVTDAGSATRMANAKMETELHFDRVNATDLNLRMNPFGSQSSLDHPVIFDGLEISVTEEPNLNKATRLDTETCKKEGIYFDDNGEEETNSQASTAVDSDVGREMNASEIAESILEDIIDKALGISPAQSQPILQDSVDICNQKFDSNTDLSEIRSRLVSQRSKDSISLGPDDLLNAIDSKMSEIDSQSEADLELGDVRSHSKDDVTGVHPLHTHILLYTQKYDAQRTLYALSCLKAILITNPRLIICALSTTNISSTQSSQFVQLQNMLIRHRRSVFGKNFFSDVPMTAIGSYRTNMYVEILISICLYLMRSYYPNLMMSKLSEEELNGNKEVQILSCEILSLLLSELVNVAKESGKGFATYLNDLLLRSKVQKVLLHCVLATVYNHRKKTPGHNTQQNITEAIISFNEENMDADALETFQLKLLRLLLVCIMLEEQIRKLKSEPDSAFQLPPEWDRIQANFQPSLSSVRYLANKPIVHQSMLLSAVLSSLKQHHMSHMHRHWIAMVTAAMPFMGKALSHVVGTVVQQLCRNIELMASLYELDGMYTSGPCQPEKAPPDHVLTLLESVAALCHHCLLESGSQQAISVLGQHSPSSASHLTTESGNSTQIFSNLINVFNPTGGSREPSPAKEVNSAASPVMEARRHILSILPRILASLTVLWKAVQISENRQEKSGKDQPCWTLGQPKVIKQFVLEFVSPISLHHGVNLLGAVAVVWTDRRQRGSSIKKVILPACEEQLLLVDVISSVKVLPIDTLLQTVRQVIRQPPPTSQDNNKKRTPLEVSMLQFLYAYLQRATSQQLLDTWSSLLALMKEGLQLNLPATGQFLLLAILSEFVHKVAMFEEKKDQKELQELCQKLLEAVSDIAGASLEQTTWLRRNLAVKPGPQLDVAMEPDDTVTDQETEPTTVTEPSLEAAPVPPKALPGRDRIVEHQRQYSVQALVMLAELTATLLDVVYRSEEKERVVPFIHNILHNVFPYLRNHSQNNSPSFRACSQMLCSLSGYQYTRKAWKKDVFDLLMDQNFFQMDELCISHWHGIIDNLMTHDKTTFKDLLARVTLAQGASLNLFSSREHEFEQRAQLLKRLSFTIFCSEIDQYHRAMPDIQERLAESLKLPSVPALQAQVFLCFRVLMLRISPRHLTSLWPTIITELIHVLLQIEQELVPDVEESRAQMSRMANLDPSWGLGNGLSGHVGTHWLKLFLSACKLLDLALALPTESLPQFQLYRWAFIGEQTVDQGKPRHRDQQPTFIPHVIRIARLMNIRFEESPREEYVAGRPLLAVKQIRSVQDLHPFFNTIAQMAQSPHSFNATGSYNSTDTISTSKSSLKPGISKSKSAMDFPGLFNTNIPLIRDSKTPRQMVENIVEYDFLDPPPRA